jgi:hypothetical protein
MASAQRIPRITECSFTDSSGISWTVEEKLRDDGIARAAEWVLMFQSQAAFRCVRRYPPDWFNLDTASLERLSWST